MSVIKVENLSKCYRLGSIGGGTLRSDVSRWLAKLRGKEDPNLKIGQEHHARQEGQDFWALQNVNFEVKQGEILGVIGRNGAGKSTLLKILSRVTAPTSGEVRVKGRIASLLEVGTGFHPELSGRENIYLNGAILGMTKAEIRKKFDEIVDFSGVETFLDTPVKRYSSGMYVRLAFAVAAHLEPEILIVDEVLAVGDAEFQTKCLGKMKDVACGGRTVLFVSHNLKAVDALCTRVLYLMSGGVKSIGMVSEQIDRYLKDTSYIHSRLAENPVPAGRLTTINRLTFKPNPCKSCTKATIDLTLSCNDRVRINDLAILFYSQDETRIAVIDLRKGGRAYEAPSGTFALSCSIESLQLVPGEYRIGLYLKTNDFDDNILDLTRLTVGDAQNDAGYVPYDAAYRGFVELPYQVLKTST